MVTKEFLDEIQKPHYSEHKNTPVGLFLHKGPFLVAPSADRGKGRENKKFDHLRLKPEENRRKQGATMGDCESSLQP
jgi:hypothetical protein